MYFFAGFPGVGKRGVDTIFGADGMTLGIVLAYVAAASVIGFVLMAWDKYQAKVAGWRVPEKTLLGMAVVGGSVGVYAAMRLFRHKTKHWYFAIGVPVIMAAQVAVMVYMGVGR